MDPPPCRQDDQSRYFLATPRMYPVGENKEDNVFDSVQHRIINSNSHVAPLPELATLRLSVYACTTKPTYNEYLLPFLCVCVCLCVFCRLEVLCDGIHLHYVIPNQFIDSPEWESERAFRDPPTDPARGGAATGALVSSVSPRLDPDDVYQVCTPNRRRLPGLYSGHRRPLSGLYAEHRRRLPGLYAEQTTAITIRPVRGTQTMSMYVQNWYHFCTRTQTTSIRSVRRTHAYKYTQHTATASNDVTAAAERLVCLDVVNAGCGSVTPRLHFACLISGMASRCKLVTAQGTDLETRYCRAGRRRVNIEQHATCARHAMYSPTAISQSLDVGLNGGGLLSF